MLVRTTSVSEDAVEKSWIWSVELLVIWAKCLGVNLSNGNRQKMSLWFVFYIVSVTLFFISAQLLCLYFFIYNYKEINNSLTLEKSYKSDTFSWNMAIDFINYAVHSIGIHFIFLSVFRSRWFLLIEAFQNLESFLNYDIFDRIRQVSTLGVFWIIISHASIFIYHITYQYGSPLMIVFCSSFPLISQLYPTTAIVLFAVISYATSNAYESIRLDVVNLLQNSITDENYCNRLLILQRRHALVCETVDCINNCFGYILGLSICFHFVSTITSSFYIFGKEEPGTFIEICYISYNFCNISLIWYPADLIRNKVRQVANNIPKEDEYYRLVNYYTMQADSVSSKLIRMQLEMKEPLKSVANTFVAQTNQFFPEINAAGFYPVSKKIIPQIIGTTLSYFIILYQFYSTEKN